MKKIYYTRVITETQPCVTCGGAGDRWENTYHNQVEKKKCYRCNGTGLISVTWSEDVTDEVSTLINRAVSLSMHKHTIKKEF